MRTRRLAAVVNFTIAAGLLALAVQQESATLAALVIAISTEFSSACGMSANSFAISSWRLKYCSGVKRFGRRWSARMWPVAMHTRASWARKSSRSRAVLWRDGAAIDLTAAAGAAEWALLSATDINDLGQIAGVGVHDGQPRAFLLTPR